MIVCGASLLVCIPKVFIAVPCWFEVINVVEDISFGGAAVA